MGTRNQATSLPPGSRLLPRIRLSGGKLHREPCYKDVGYYQESGYRQEPGYKEVGDRQEASYRLEPGYQEASYHQEPVYRQEPGFEHYERRDYQPCNHNLTSLFYLQTSPINGGLAMNQSSSKI